MIMSCFIVDILGLEWALWTKSCFNSVLFQTTAFLKEETDALLTNRTRQHYTITCTVRNNLQLNGTTGA